MPPNRRSMLKLALLAVFACLPALARPADIIVFSTPTLRHALEELAPEFERSTGHRLVATYDSAAALQRRIAAGAEFDVALLLPGLIDDLAKHGRVDPASATPLARAAAGVAVHTGLPVPDVATVPALKAALIQARSYAYGPDSASGGYFVQLLDRLQVPDAHAKLRPVAGGHVMAAVASGDADLTVITIPNIVGVPGVTLAGKLPDSLQKYTVFAAGVAASAPASAPGRELIRFLMSPPATAAFERHGLERATP